jgi:hypothetical protein
MANRTTITDESVILFDGKSINVFLGYINIPNISPSFKFIPFKYNAEQT